jgi:hypothetical protein
VTSFSIVSRCPWTLVAGGQPSTAMLDLKVPWETQPYREISENLHCQNCKSFIVSCDHNLWPRHAWVWVFRKACTQACLGKSVMIVINLWLALF